MDTLPAEVIDCILEHHLSQSDLAHGSATCRAWYNILIPRLYFAPEISTKQQLDGLAESAARVLVSNLDLRAVKDHVTEHHLRQFSKYPIRSINLSDCSPISTESLNGVLKTSLDTLETAVLADCSLNAESLELLRQTQIIHLDLSGTMLLPCHAIDTPHHLEELIDPDLSKLRKLSVAGCNWVDSTTVANIARGFPRLVELSLFWCENVHFSACVEIVHRLPHLQHLDLQHVPAVNSRAAAGELLRNHPCLRSIVISYRRQKETVYKG